MSRDTEYRDHGRKQLVAAIKVLDKLSITIGFQGRTGLTRVRAEKRRRARRQGRTRGSTTTVETPLRMVDLATIHEFGAPRAGIPERSFLRATMQNDPARVRAAMRAVVKAAISGGDYMQAAARVGLELEAAVRKTLTDLRTPPLRPATIRARFRRTGDRDPNPLVDTGQLRASITHQLRVGGRRVGGSS